MVSCFHSINLSSSWLSKKTLSLEKSSISEKRQTVFQFQSRIISGNEGFTAQAQSHALPVAWRKPARLLKNSSYRATGNYHPVYWQKNVIPKDLCSCTDWNIGTSSCSVYFLCKTRKCFFGNTELILFLQDKFIVLEKLLEVWASQKNGPLSSLKHQFWKCTSSL